MSSCVSVRTPQGVISILPSSGPSSAETGNAHEFFSPFVLSRALPVAFRHAATVSSTAFFPREHLKCFFFFLYKELLETALFLHGLGKIMLLFLADVL